MTVSTKKLDFVLNNIPDLQGVLNFNFADVTANVADVTLCESLSSRGDKSAFFCCCCSYEARKANI